MFWDKIIHLLGTSEFASVKLVYQLILNFQFKKFNVWPQTMPKRPTELASCIQGGWCKKREGGISETNTETLTSSTEPTELYCYLFNHFQGLHDFVDLCLTMDPKGN